MHKVLKVKLYPTFKQAEMLDRHFDAFRFTYNLCLEYRITLWNAYKKTVSGYDMGKEILEIRKDTDWLKRCKAECVREAAHALEETYKKFFKGSGFPKFKNKKSKQYFRAYQNISCKGGGLHFYGSLIKFKTSNEYKELLNVRKIKQVTFTRDLCGDYWASCLVENVEETITPGGKGFVGLDLGLKDIVITSDGVVYGNKKFYKQTEYKLLRLQRKFSKTKKKGKNREKIRLKIAKTHRRITRQRNHYYHQITNEIIRENQTIVIETLKITNMIKNRKLARSIHSAAWGTIVSMLEYKSKQHGRKLKKVGAFYPSSKTCSACGSVKEKLFLNERIFLCENCGLEIDRDLNAAVNIKNAGLKIPSELVEDTSVGSAYETRSNRLIHN